MALYDKASLVLIPSGTKTGTVYSQKPISGDGDFDFTRSTYATRVNSQGLIEKERSNLLLQSNNFDTTWTIHNTNRTSGQSGYDGSSDAWLLTKTASSGRIEQIISATTVTTKSIYVKSNESGWCQILNGVGYAYYDLENGVIGSTGGDISSEIISVGNGWYRISLVTNGCSYFRLYPAEADNDKSASSGSIYIQDAQLEQGLVATDYIETTTSAVYEGITDNVPRLDYDGDCPSLLLEPQRSNLVTDSEYFEGSFWQLGANSTLSFVSDLNPSGTQGCYRLQNPASSSTYLASGSLGVINNDSVFSVYVKSNTGSNQDFGLYTSTENMFGFTATTEWQRFQIDAPSGFSQVGINNQNDAYSSDILIYGAQLEEGSYATSYIPTYGTSVTRNRDICNNAGDSTIFNDAEGVLFVEVALLENDGNNAISISDGTNGNRIFISYNSSGRLDANVLSGGTYQAIFNYTGVDNTKTFNKIALKYKQNTFALWVNGVEVSVDTNGITPVGLDRLNFATASVITDNFYGKCKALAYFNRALTDTELADLTT